MLTFFPTPYPDEWWYSGLCRYYERSGLQQYSAGKEALFSGKTGIHMGTLFPNGSIAEVVRQLPEGVFSTEQVILRNTPFLYYTRMYPEAEKRRILVDLCDGKTVQLTYLWKSFSREEWKPGYCPECVKEDRKTYGEPYYRVQHQIPIITACSKHRCRLKETPIANPRWALNNCFLPLSQMKPESRSEPAGEPELLLSTVAERYWRMPLSVGPNDLENLYEALLKSGYATKCNQTGMIVDKEKLQNDLEEYFGKALVRQVFGERITTSMMNRIKDQKQLLPERYVLIEALRI